MFTQITSKNVLSTLVVVAIFPFSTLAGPMSLPNADNSIVDRVPKPPRNSVEHILQIAPKSADCKDATSECRTAEQIAPAINKAFLEYYTLRPVEMAAIISLEAFESGDFKFSKNHFPGRPGQGTAAMLMPNFVSEYAASIPAIADKAKGKSPEAVLDLVNADDFYNFGAAAWYFREKCRPEIVIGVQSGTEVGWEEYIKDCLKTTVTPERKAYWLRAVKAFGVEIT